MRTQELKHARSKAALFHFIAAKTEYVKYRSPTSDKGIVGSIVINQRKEEVAALLNVVAGHVGRKAWYDNGNKCAMRAEVRTPVV